ncbi:ClpP/crotonase-like domain-containing protein [Mycotypha africana]|uniref:ClpP/crotonase-like domain-containing protein n=1 Tax=Mycotypha africana TaxID=64632 RepID=UPI0022FFD2AE|nr:ClpP/crotonase-like domain-containing protein [Mycotypha africana]KAI8970350.1 ClpP/crotonase-like domain-containing protein [Mycotypha africana]
MPQYQYETVNVEVLPEGVAHVQLNRPNKLNAFNDQLVNDVRIAFEDISKDSNILSVVISGSGRMFTAGLDLTETKLKSFDEGDPARAAYKNRAHIENFQAAFTAIELCTKPVIAAIHNACFGAGVDLITACDIRYCTSDSFFCIKEVDVGLAADVGSLQRLPKVIGNQSLVRELCFTGRNMYADEALACGFVSKVTDDYNSLMGEALKLARTIASKSPIAVLGTKHLLNYSRDHSVAEGLAYTVTWNAPMLNTEDIPLSIQAFVTKRPAKYSKL